MQRDGTVTQRTTVRVAARVSLLNRVPARYRLSVGAAGTAPRLASVISRSPAPGTTTVGPVNVFAPNRATRPFTPVTTSPFGHPGCSGRDLARAAAAIGLGIAVLLFAADGLLLLRRRRLAGVPS